MGDFGQIAQNRHGVRPVRILRRQIPQGAGGIPAQDHIEKIHHTAPIRQTQHSAHIFGARLAGAVADRLIQKRERITGRAFGGAGDESERIVGDLCLFRIRDFAQQSHEDLWLNPAQIKALTAR